MDYSLSVSPSCCFHVAIEYYNVPQLLWLLCYSVCASLLSHVRMEVRGTPCRAWFSQHVYNGLNLHL